MLYFMHRVQHDLLDDKEKEILRNYKNESGQLDENTIRCKAAKFDSGYETSLRLGKGKFGSFM